MRLTVINKSFRYWLLLAVIVISGTVFSQQAPPFYKEIQQFKQQDSAVAVPRNGILFIGSSSFTKWKDLPSYFPGYPVINRGFGGSSLPHLVQYAPDIIFAYQPKQIIVYCGENDLAGDAAVTGDTVFERFKTLFQLIRAQLPEVPIAYVSMKPSPGREKYLPAMREGNRLIQKFMQASKKGTYINVYNAMLEEQGNVMTDIFIEDRLHMNAKGYAIWQRIIAPFLIK